MSLLGNLLWFVCGGLASGLSWRAENLNLPLDAGRTLCYNIIRRGDIAKW